MSARIAVTGENNGEFIDPTGLNRELLDGPWNLATWGHGSVTSFLDSELMNAVAVQLAERPDVAEDMKVGLWFLAHIREMAVGAAIHSDRMEIMLHVGSQWANPNKVLTAFQTHMSAWVNGHADAADKLRALAEGSPDTPLGMSHRTGVGGLVASFFTVGIVTAISIPALIKYIGRA